MPRPATCVVWLGLCCLALLPAGAVTVKTWSVSSEEQFATGTLEGTAIDERGEVRLAPPQESLWGPGEGIVWAVRPARDGAAFVALSGPGRVLRVAQGLPAVTLYEAPGESLVTAMIADEDGGATIGLSPEGQVLRIGPAGGASVIAETGSTFVWALARDEDGTLWVGTGLPGRLLRLRPGGAPETVFESGDDPVRCIAAAADGETLFGTGGRGRVLRIGRDGRPFVLLDADEAEIVSLVVVDDSGAAFALAADAHKQPSAKPEGKTELPQVEGGVMRVVVTAPAADDGESGAAERRESAPRKPPVQRFAARPGGALYRLDPDGSTPKIWSTTTEMPFGLAPGRGGHVLIGTGDKGRIWMLDREGMATLLLRIPSNQVSAMAATPSGQILVGGTTDARVVRLGAGFRDAGSYLGHPIDAGTSADWGRLRWSAVKPRGTDMKLFVRAGNSAEPDETWTDWARLDGGVDGVDVDLHPTRFLQVRADLISGRGETPRLAGLDLRYQPRNRGPAIQVLGVEPPGIVWMRGPVQSTTRTGPLVADDPISRQAASALTRNHRSPGAVRKAYEAGVRTFTWTAKDPDGDRLRYKLEIRREGEETWFPIVTDLDETFFSWDARPMEDGAYRARLVVDDSRDNPPGSTHSARRVSASFRLDNTRPTLGDPRIERAGGFATLNFVARDSGGSVSALEFSSDGGAWQPLLPLDGVADSAEEWYVLTVPVSGAGGASRTLRIRVADATGNLGGATWSIPAP